MKGTLKILIAILVASGCSASENPVEDSLFSCLIEEYKTNGIDLYPLLDSLENHYISIGILNDKSGQAKMDFYRKIATTGEVPKMKPYDIADSVAQIRFFQEEIENCLKTNGVDSTSIRKSKYHQLMEDFKLMNEVNPKNAATSHTRILTSSDFEHPYFRAHMLISFTRIYERESAFIIK